MTQRIPDDYLQDLLARTDIVELIGARVALRRSGAEYAARCPFHEEKSPSFTVSPAKQFYHCFGCGAHGSAIGFLMAHDRMGFMDAVRDLAARAGMPLPQDDIPARPRPDAALYDVLTRAAAFYRTQLRRHPQAGAAVDYLKGRGLSGAIAARFGLGFAPPGGRALQEALRDTQPALLEGAGLTVQREGRTLDKFRARITFPIHDEQGRVVAFGGRVLGDGTPKYLNSPETPVFHKGAVLYNLDRVLKSRPPPSQLLVVEGYMDVIALAQFGVDNVVATLGTAATSAHLRRAFRVASEVVFCFDGDAAGRRAAGRALENVLPDLHDGRQVRFLYLPEGADPDTLVRQEGADGLRARLAGAVPLSDELFTRLHQGTDLRTPENRAALMERARPLVSRLPEGVYRTLIVERLAQLSGLAGETTREHLRPAPARRPPLRPGRRNAAPPTLAMQLAGVLVQHPALAGACAAALDHLPADADTAFLSRLAGILGGPAPAVGALIERWRDTDDGATLATILDRADPPLDEHQARQALDDGLARLARVAQRKRVESLLRGRRLSDLSADERRALAPVRAAPRDAES